MITTAESGITGVGVECHVCSGAGGMCTADTDGGSVTNCGDGVQTCLLAASKKLTAFKSKISYDMDLDNSLHSHQMNGDHEHDMSRHMAHHK